jgi:hypothetical protein
MSRRIVTACTLRGVANQRNAGFLFFLLDEEAEGEGPAADVDRGGHHIGRRGDHRHGVAIAITWIMRENWRA